MFGHRIDDSLRGFIELMKKVDFFYVNMLRKPNFERLHTESNLCHIVPKT